MNDYTTLFGRYATHHMYPQVLIISDEVREDRHVHCAVAETVGTQMKRVYSTKWLPLSELTLFPVDLYTEDDFEAAPEGTIVVRPDGYAREKHCGWWDTHLDSMPSKQMADIGVWEVLRWGKQ